MAGGSVPPASSSAVYSVNRAPAAGDMCTIAVAPVMPGNAARTNVSGVCRRWVAVCALRVCPRCCNELSSSRGRDVAVVKDGFAAPDRPSDDAVETPVDVRTHLVPLLEIRRG